MFRFIDKLFDSGSLSLIIEDANCDFLKRMLKLVQMEITGCKDIYKLIDGINLLCQFIQVIFKIQNIPFFKIISIRFVEKYAIQS